MKTNKIMRALSIALVATMFIWTDVSGQGRFDWAKAITTVGAGTVDITDIRADASNNIIVVGTYSSGVSLDVAGSITLPSFGNTDVFIAKFNSSGTPLWARRIGGTGAEESSYMRVDNAGNIYTVGAFRSPTLTVESTVLTNSGSGTREPFVVKYNSSGSLAWAKRLFWGTDQDNLQDIALSLDGRYIVMVGTFRSAIFNYDDGAGGGTISRIGSVKDQFVARYDTAGVFQDIDQYYNSQQQTAFKQVHSCLFGGYYITGDIRGNLSYAGAVRLTARDNVAMDAMVIRVDDNLAFLWGRSGGSTGTGFEHVNSSTVSRYGNVYLTGKTEAATLTFDSTESWPSNPLPVIGGPDFYIAKYSSSGNLQWLRRKGTTAYDNAYGLDIYREQVQFAGIYGGPITINQDLLDCEALDDTATGFAIFDRWGNEVGGRCLSGNNQDEGRAVAFDSNGETYVAGVSRSNPLTVGSIALSNPNPGSYFGFLVNYEYPFSVVTSREQHISCNGVCDGEIIVTPYYGVDPIIYTWSHDALLKDSIATGLCAGNYTVTIKDARDSTEVLNFILAQPAVLNIGSSVTQITCYNGANGAIDITVTGGTPPYSYFWTGNGVVATQEDQAGLRAGAYSVTVTDHHGCTQTENFNLTQPGQVLFTGSVVSNITIPPGDNGAIDLNVSGGTLPYSFNWTGPDPTLPSASEDLSGLTVPGNDYKVVVTYSSICTADTIFTVADDTCLIISVPVQTNVSCNGGSDGYAKVVPQNHVGPLTYEWKTVPGGVTVSTTDELNNASAGQYSVTVTDGGAGCGSPSIAFLTITQPAAMGLGYNPTNVTCNGACNGKIEITASNGTPPYSYAWTGPGGYTSSAEDIYNLCPGNYNVLVTDSKGCTVGQNNIPISEPTVITCNLVSTTNILCNGEQTGELCVSVSGGTGTLRVLWDDPAAQTTLCTYFLEAGNYRVTVTDDAGCSKAFGPYTVSQRPPFNVVPNITSVSCYGGNNGNIILTVSGGTPPFSYQWYPCGGGSLLASSKDLINVAAGCYTVIITDANNCIFTNDYIVTEPAVMDFSVSKNDVLGCFGDLTGEIHLTGVTGGTTPYTYSINGGVSYQSSPDFTALAAGTYNVWVKDSKNCLKEHSLNPVVLLQPAKVYLVDSVKSDVAGCFGDASGTITLTGGGGTPPYTYSVNGGANWVDNGGMFTALAAGTYNLGVRDNNSCTYLGGQFTIGQPAEIMFSSAAANPSCAGYTDGAITVTASGGTGLLEYSKDGGMNWQSSNMFTAIGAGSYSISVRDANLCRKDGAAPVVVTGPEALVITGIDSANLSCGGLVDGSVTVTASGGTTPVSYTLNPGGIQNATGVFTGLSPGTYTVSINDANGCGPLVTRDITVTGPPVLVFYDAITPNGDGVNDLWNIRINDCYPRAVVRIYSTWGTKVFESAEGYPEPWDGKTGGRALPAGTYFYVIDMNGDGSEILKGSISIIR